MAAIARAANALQFVSAHTWAAGELSGYYPSKAYSVARRNPEYTSEAKEALQLAHDAALPDLRKGAMYELLRVPSFGQVDDDPSPLRVSDYNTLVRARELCAERWMEVLAKPPPRSEECNHIPSLPTSSITARRSRLNSSAVNRRTNDSSKCASLSSSLNTLHG